MTLRFESFFANIIKESSKVPLFGVAVAREEVPIDTLVKMADAFRQIADDVTAAVGALKEAKMPSALLHAKTVLETRMPELIDWSATVRTNAVSQATAFKLGVKSQALIEKEANARRTAKKASRKTRGQG